MHPPEASKVLASAPRRTARAAKLKSTIDGNEATASVA